MSYNNDLTDVINTINDDIYDVVQKHLLPYFEVMQNNRKKMQMIESILREIPEFQELIKENQQLKEELCKNKVTVQAQAQSQAQAQENKIILEVKEKNDTKKQSVNESDIYNEVKLSENIGHYNHWGAENNSEAEESEAEASEAEASEAEEEEVFIVEIDGHGSFYTTNEQNGDIYKIQEDEDVGDLAGKFVNGTPTFN